MIECTSCNQVLEAGSFSPQKTNPTKLYKWCDECRKEKGSLRNNIRWDYKREVEEMRRKALERTRFNANEAHEIRILAELGQSHSIIAEQYGNVSVATINKVVAGKGVYGKM